MPAVTRVKKAQQRYAMVPVKDPVTGEQMSVPKLGKDGAPKTTKTGRAIVQRLSVADKTRPLPPLECDYCRKPIEVGTAYKHITPKSGPYGGTRRNRHAGCPEWMPWDYSSSLSARLSQIAHDFDNTIESVEDTDSVQEALTDAAEAVREIAEEKREGASNIEEGFGHATGSSDELIAIADSLDQWADEIADAEIPDLPEIDDVRCEECEGSGNTLDAAGELVTCQECDGLGEVTPDELSDEQMDEWRCEVQASVGIVGEAPV